MGVIPTYKRQHIIDFSMEGLSQRAIGRKVDVSLHGVQGVLKRAKNDLGTSNLPKNGRPRKLSDRAVSQLVISSKRDPKKMLPNYELNVN